MSELLVYGATGYTGSLIVEEAVRIGLRPKLAGRSRDKLAALARKHGLDWVAFDLDDTAALHRGLGGLGGLGGVSAVLQVAGPFSRTGEQMMDACLTTGVHYFDLCGEIAVLEKAASRDDRAKARGIMLLSGAGFDVVPSDCLIGHAHRRLPDADTVTLSIGGLAVMSRGTARAFMESIAQGTLVRRGGKLVELGGALRSTCDFGGGPKPTIAVSWGDVSTAWWSTRIPDITAYFESAPELERIASLPRVARKLLSTRPGQWLLNRQIDRMPPGPTAEQGRSLTTTLVAEASNASGRRVVSRMTAPEGYRLTALAAVEIARRVMAGETRPGYQTPATMFGADFATSLPGVTLQDLA